MNNANTCTIPGYLREKAYLATVESYDADSQTASFKQRNKLCLGDSVEVISPGKVGIPFVIDNMKNDKGEDIESAPHPLMIFTSKVPFPLKAGDIIREA